jgi:hypothetical protein
MDFVNFHKGLRQQNVTHTDKHKKLMDFVKSSHEYLDVKEAVDSINDAQQNLAKANRYLQERKVNDGKNALLKVLGEQIQSAEFEMDDSSFKFKTPQEIQEREAQVDAEFKSLEEKATQKKAVLEDDLAREQFRSTLDTNPT